MRLSKTIAVIVASALAGAALYIARGDSSGDEVCKTDGPCRTKNIVREAGSAKFVLFGGLTFEPLPRWTKRAIYETLRGTLVRFEYERPDKSTACTFSLFHFVGGPPDLDFAWWMYVGSDVEKGDVSLVTEERIDAYRHIAIVKYDDGPTYQVEMRRFDDVQGGRLYELAHVSVAPSTTAINKSDADIAACHVKLPAA